MHKIHVNIYVIYKTIMNINIFLNISVCRNKKYYVRRHHGMRNLFDK